MLIYQDNSTIIIMYIRRLSLEDENNDNLFLWGARQVGKTTLLEQLFPQNSF